MEALLLMLPRNNKKYLALSLLALAWVSNVSAEALEGLSGEIMAIPASEQIENEELVIKTSSGRAQLVSLPFVKQDQLITKHQVDVKVRWVDFGESRITIADKSKVTLSSSDQQRANREAVEIKLALSILTKDITPSFNFIPPVPGVITSPFGKQRFINGLPRSAHLALDLGGNTGTPIVAPLKGRVVLVGDFFYTGHTLILDHGRGLFSSYAHMSEVKAQLGDFVEQTQIIGLVGATGRVTGPHLHWTVYFDGNKVNPASLIQENYLSSLLQALKDQT